MLVLRNKGYTKRNLMNTRYKIIIAGILCSILLYSFTYTDWIERVKLLFIDKYAPNEHPTTKDRNSLVYYLKTKIEQHLAYGKTLEQMVLSEKKEEKKPNKTQQYQLLLWKLYANALVTIVDKKSVEQAKDVEIAGSTTFLAQMLTKFQKTMQPKPSEITTLTKAAVDIAAERLFAKLLTQHFIQTVQDSIKNLSQNTVQEIIDTILMHLRINTDLASRYLPLMQETHLSFFDTLSRLIAKNQYDTLAETMATFINAINTLLQQAATSDPTLARTVLIQNIMEAMRPFTTSIFGPKSKQTDRIRDAYLNNEQTLVTIINTLLARSEQVKENTIKLYENLVTLISYIPHKRQIEWSKKIQALFVSILKPYTALCQDTKLNASFMQTITIVGSEKSTNILTVSDAGKKIAPHIRMLLYTLNAVILRCGEKSTEHKAALETLKKSLRISSKKQQEQAIIAALEEQCTIRTQSILTITTKPFSSAMKSFAQLFAIDTIDIDQFLQSIIAQKQTQNQLANIVKTKGKLYQQKLAIFFQEYIQKFSRLVTTKYQILQRLYVALTAEAQKQYETKDPNVTNAAIRTWLVSYQLVYEKIKKQLQNAVISGNTTETMQSLIAEFIEILPFLSFRSKKY
jgi:hypothetical protein